MTATEPERLLGDYLLYNDRQAAPMKSQQHGYLNKTGTVTPPTGMPVWMGEISVSFYLMKTAGNY